MIRSYKEYEHLDYYINDVLELSSDDNFLDKIRNNVIDDDEKNIQLSKFEGMLLQFFIKSFNIHNILEIGTMFGYSAAHMALSMSDDSSLITIEKDIERYNIAYNNLKKINKNIKCILGDANDILYTEEILNKEFDMVFIDANKSAYCKYLDWIEKFLKKGTLIIADNCFLSGKVKDKNNNSNMVKGIKNFNKRISDKNKYHSIMLPIYDGFFIAVKKI